MDAYGETAHILSKQEHFTEYFYSLVAEFQSRIRSCLLRILCDASLAHMPKGPTSSCHLHAMHRNGKGDLPPKPSPSPDTGYNV